MICKNLQFYFLLTNFEYTLNILFLFFIIFSKDDQINFVAVLIENKKMINFHCKKYFFLMTVSDLNR